MMVENIQQRKGPGSGECVSLALVYKFKMLSEMRDDQYIC
jgi:hypothetical protein